MHTFKLSFTFTLPRVETFFFKEKMALRELLRKFFIVDCNLNYIINGKLVAAEYLFKLSDNNEENYKVFERFSCECSNTLLCIMHSLGHYDDDETLIDNLTYLELRIYFEKNDAERHVAAFMRRIQNGRERGRKN